MKPFLLLLAGLGLAMPLAANPFADSGPRKAPPHEKGEAWPQKKEDGTRQASVKADLSKPLTSITRWHFGQNTSWWSRHDWNLDPDRIAKARAAGIGSWRFPGGSSSDNYIWDGRYGDKYAKAKDGGDNTRMNTPEMLNSQGFIELVRKTDTTAFLTLNYGLARYGSLDEAIKLAVNWIQWFKKQGMRITHAELGNENYGDWEEGSKANGKRLSGRDYGQDFNKFSAALKAVDPDIKLGAVVVAIDNEEEWSGFFGWNRGVLSEVKDTADFLIYHEYFFWPWTPEPDKKLKDMPYPMLLGHLKMLEDSRKAFDAMFEKYCGGRRIPVVLNEFNLVNASPPQTLEAVNMLFTAGVLGESIRNGFSATSIWDWKNGLHDTDKGDMGMLAHNDPATAEDTPRPSFYAYAIWAKAGGSQLMESSVEGENLRAYATRFHGGEAGLVFVNESESPVEVSVLLSGYKGRGLANGWLAQAPGFGSKTISFNGVEGPKGGGGPFPLGKPLTLKAKNGKFSALLPPVSLSGFVIH